jgi:hypothetical protein
MRYYLDDNGGWMTVSGDAAMFSVVPDGFREVTEAEYQQAAGVILVELPSGGGAEGDLRGA